MSSWHETILDAASPKAAWQGIFARLLDLARTTPSPVELHNKTVEPDRLIAESAWELWQEYPATAERTSDALKAWWAGSSASGHAVLILDGLSLRELTPLLGGASARGIEPVAVRVTGSEVPSETNQFAQSLGVPSRSSLANDGAPGGFAFGTNGVYTDVLSGAFDGHIATLPHVPNVFIWYDWPDILVHTHARAPDQVYNTAAAGLQSDGFWQFVDRLRTGRRLIITADHGYARSQLFSTNESDPDVVSALKDTFAASRCKPVLGPWARALLPPVVFTHNGHHVVMGQRKWTVQGGFPYVCHGGLSLLEVAVPFIEFAAK